jgi:ankyrin repeat protein
VSETDAGNGGGMVGLDRELELAIFQGDISRAHEALARGANPSARYGSSYGSGQTLLMSGVGSSKRVEVVRLLLHYGADVNAVDDSGWSALHQAANSASTVGAAQVVRMLLEAGADANAINQEGETPLNYAVTETDGDTLSVVTTLLEAGADPHAPSNMLGGPGRNASTFGLGRDEMRSLFTPYARGSQTASGAGCAVCLIVALASVLVIVVL